MIEIKKKTAEELDTILRDILERETYIDENRSISCGEMAYIQGLNDNELQEFEDECYEAKEEKETVLVEDHLTEIGFEKERRGL